MVHQCIGKRLQILQKHICVFYLKDYFDHQLLDLLEVDLPVDCKRSRFLGITTDNHKSTLQHELDVIQYFVLSFQKMMVVFHLSPFHTHILPFYFEQA